MIKYVEGDILKSKAKAIAHGVAPNDDFKQGLALSLRKQWPSLYKDFRHFCHTKNPKEGDVWAWKGVGGPIIFNLMTQDAPKTRDSHPGKASLTNINHSMKNLVKELKEEGVDSLAITKVATGVGGMDWKDVKPLLEEHLKGLDMEIYIYETYKENVSAEE
ncbi:MAG: macro domain-containing protein [Bdellovibrionaceae bacterium]|nr:macro domain-containing protein [Pseudobdellovibrionaceae bacterium]